MSLCHEACRFHATADSSPVVGYRQAYAVRILCQAHCDLGGIRVLKGVMQRFLGYPENRQRYIIGEMEII